MAKKDQVLKHTINDKTRSIVKIVEVPLNEDFQEPDGYILKDIYNTEVSGSERFYAVLVKIQEVMQGQVSHMPARNKPVNLKDNKSPKATEKK